MAATIALLLLALPSKFKNVHMVYLNDVLLKKDEEEFKMLWKMVPQGAKVHYHSNISFTPLASSIIVCDECDDMVFNNPILFMKFVKKRAVIALTASATDNVEKGIERQVLRMMNFKIYENLIDEIYTQSQNPEFE